MYDINESLWIYNTGHLNLYYHISKKKNVKIKIVKYIIIKISKIIANLHNGMHKRIDNIMHYSLRRYNYFLSNTTNKNKVQKRILGKHTSLAIFNTPPSLCACRPIMKGTGASKK